MSNTVTILILLGSVILGLLYCFYGMRFPQRYLAIYLFVGGFALLFDLLATYASALPNLLLWLIPTIVGGALALLPILYSKVARFIAGGLLGIAVVGCAGYILPIATIQQENFSLVYNALFFVVGGIVSLVINSDLMIVIDSAMWGSYSVATSVGILVGLLLQPSAEGLDLLMQPIAEGHTQIFTDLTTLSPISIFATIPGYVIVITVLVLAILGSIYQLHKYKTKNIAK